MLFIYGGVKIVFIYILYYVLLGIPKVDNDVIVILAIFIGDCNIL